MNSNDDIRRRSFRPLSQKYLETVSYTTNPAVIINGDSGRMVYIAQQCFCLSDEGIEDAVYHSQAIRAIAGVDLTHEWLPMRHAAEGPSSSGTQQADAPDLR